MNSEHDLAQDANVLPYYRRSISRLKGLIWIYFWMLILEGAVRKWIPALSDPFLIIRDPIALMIWIQGARLKIVDNRYWLAFYFFAFPVTLLGLLQVIVLSVPFPIFLFGWRSYVLHLPVIFVSASVLNFQDLKKVGKWIMLASLPMTVLILMQYGAAPDSWLNRGASLDGGQLASALGHIRPAGTFSFITGPASFVPLVGAFVLLGLGVRNTFPIWLTIASGVSLLIVLPFTGSRTIALEVATLLAMAIFGAAIRGTIVFKPDQFPKIVAGGIVAAVLIAGTYSIPFVQDGVNTFTERWTNANESEGGTSSAIESRGFGDFTRILEYAADAPLLGIGIGSGSNFASSYRTGVVGFSLGEGAWEREVNELGSLFGLAFVIGRTLITVCLVALSLMALKRGNILPWYLLAGCVTNLLSGLLDQPTAQGFLIFVSALVLTGLTTGQFNPHMRLRSSIRNGAESA